MPIDADFHSHLSYTSAHEMALAARAKGLSVLGLKARTSTLRRTRPFLRLLHLDFQRNFTWGPGQVGYTTAETTGGRGPDDS